MEQIFLHLIGDYITQNNWLANTKVKNSLIGYLACLIHCLIYSLPFLLIGSVPAVGVIFITHFLMDKYRLSRYVLRFNNWTKTPTGLPKTTPDYIAVWLMFIVDNIFHIIINYYSLKFL
jgi:hypothetical protein